MQNIENFRTLGYNLKTTGELIRAAITHPEGIVKRSEMPIGASIDVTSDCNLRCRHCYLFEKDDAEENLSDEQFLNKLTEFRRNYPSILHCTWVGGEPLIRKNLLRKAVSYFPANWVVTNGTIPIDGEWKNTAFHISIDGTRDVHNYIRRLFKEEHSSNYSVYDRAKQVANKASAPVFAHTVINKLNADSLSQLLAEWKSDTKIRGFCLSFQTPLQGDHEQAGLALDDKQKREVVQRLLDLKEEHGDFIVMSKKQIELYLPENQTQSYGKNCRVPRAVVSLDSKFDPKKPCVMGEDMDCDRCGCVIPTILTRLRKFDLEVLKYSVGTIMR